MEIVFSQEAENDVVQQAQYIAEDNGEIGAEVFDQVWYTCTLLASMPQMGAPVETLLDTGDLADEIVEILHAKPLLEGLRRFPVKKFKRLLIFYKADDNKLSVERVLHASRDIPVIFASMESEL